jgi:hypothetical protein
VREVKKMVKRRMGEKRSILLLGPMR